MQQLIHGLRSDAITLANVPQPVVQPGVVLIANAFSVVSAGTERSTRALAGKSLLGKALARPDQVRRVLEKVRTEGLMSTLRQVDGRLAEPVKMGYSAAGIVVACGSGVKEFRPGDRVASNGPHAEVVAVPRLLCAKVPDGVPLDHGAFGILGSIALHGVRLSGAGLGDTVLVVGLGLIGQLTVSLLRAAGARVLGMDLDASRCDLAVRMGAEWASPEITAEDLLRLTGGHGVDAALITASTASNAPLNLSVAAVRKKARIVLVGVAGLELDRRPFYFKECEFVVSCSYGPGRYDPDYEERGRDYPLAYVRWTEQRNLGAVLDLMATGRLNVAPLVSHVFPLERAVEAYDLIEGTAGSYMGVLLQYPGIETMNATVSAGAAAAGPSVASPRTIGVLGAGSFARTTLIPALQRNGGLVLKKLCSAGGLSAAAAGHRLGFETAVADEGLVLGDAEIGTVFILTRHDLHGPQVVRALQAGKHVFVEKPLCLSLEELDSIGPALTDSRASGCRLMVGFNRRFAPETLRVKRFLAASPGPVAVSVRFNAGPIPADHWTQDDEVGGGRILGEACHGIDLATFLTGSLPVRVYAEAVPGTTDDSCFITLRHANGSISSIAYLSDGDRAFPKERVEVIGGGRVAVIDDFRRTTTCADGKVKEHRTAQQDKGHAGEIKAFLEALISGSPSPIPWQELRAVTRATILAVRSLREGVPFDVP